MLERRHAIGLTTMGKSNSMIVVVGILTMNRYKDQNGWPLTKVVLVGTEAGVELHYPPFDIVVTRL